MPGAGQDLSFAAPAPFARCRWEGGTSQAAEADRRELMRAKVQHGHIAAMNIEDSDRPSLQLHDLTRAGRDLLGPSHDILLLTHALPLATGTGRALFHASHDLAWHGESCAPQNPAYLHPSAENRSRTSACGRRGTSRACA